jgi:hypothetical protein
VSKRKVHVVVQSGPLGTLAVLGIYERRKAALEFANTPWRKVITMTVKRK